MDFVKVEDPVALLRASLTKRNNNPMVLQEEQMQNFFFFVFFFKDNSYCSPNYVLSEFTKDF